MDEYKNLKEVIQNPDYQMACSKGDYEVSIAKLPIGTYVANCLEQHKANVIIEREYGRAYASPEEIGHLPEEDRKVIEQEASRVSEAERYTICGTMGEMWNVPEKKLSGYRTPENERIDPEKLTPEFQTMRTETDPEKKSINHAIQIPKDIHMEFTTEGGSAVNLP